MAPPSMIMERVIEKAKEFLSTSGYYSPKLESVKFDQTNRTWILSFDIGVINKEIKSVEIHDDTETVVGFS